MDLIDMDLTLPNSASGRCSAKMNSDVFWRASHATNQRWPWQKQINQMGLLYLKIT